MIGAPSDERSCEVAQVWDDTLTDVVLECMICGAEFFATESLVQEAASANALCAARGFAPLQRHEIATCGGPADPCSLEYAGQLQRQAEDRRAEVRLLCAQILAGYPTSIPNDIIRNRPSDMAEIQAAIKHRRALVEKENL